MSDRDPSIYSALHNERIQRAADECLNLWGVAHFQEWEAEFLTRGDDA